MASPTEIGTDKEVIERVEAAAPGLAPTIKGYLAKSDPASWVTLLISILIMIQSASAFPPSAEEIASAIWFERAFESDR